eukprot:6194311-Pleurochrysis_carterae.AAC.3
MRVTSQHQERFPRFWRSIFQPRSTTCARHCSEWSSRMDISWTFRGHFHSRRSKCVRFSMRVKAQGRTFTRAGASVRKPVRSHGTTRAWMRHDREKCMRAPAHHTHVCTTER